MKMMPSEFLEKADYEGGLASGFSYGLRSGDLDDSDDMFNSLVNAAEYLYQKFQLVENELYEHAYEKGYEYGTTE